MTKFQNKLLSILVSGSIAMGTVSSVFAVDTITITGNGSGSGNIAGVTNTQTSTVSQTNSAEIVNNISSATTTGGNIADSNTGGDVTVSTGDASSQISVDTMLNSNSVTENCCDTGSIDVLLSGNGSESSNTVEAVLSNTNTVVQTNLADVENTVNTGAVTGNNTADSNTGGNVRVLTGEATSRVGITTEANANTANIGGVAQSQGGASLGIIGNGADSTNGISLFGTNANQAAQTNSANVLNDVAAETQTGYNTADNNTGGSVLVSTGNAASLVGVETKANFNWADINCCGTFGVDALVSGNGADSYNTMYLDLSNQKDIVQSNSADVENQVLGETGTGNNGADANTGDTVQILTGGAQSIVGLDNMLNFNHANLDCCLSDLNASLERNGANSENGIIYAGLNTAADYQLNGLSLFNTVGSESPTFTGGNIAGDNTGDESSSSRVLTGNAVALTHVANSVNMNDVGSNDSLLPGFDLEFDFSMNWVTHLLSLVHM